MDLKCSSERNNCILSEIKLWHLVMIIHIGDIFLFVKITSEKIHPFFIAQSITRSTISTGISMNECGLFSYFLLIFCREVVCLSRCAVIPNIGKVEKVSILYLAVNIDKRKRIFCLMLRNSTRYQLIS